MSSNYASAHITDFITLGGAVAWRRRLRGARVPGLRWVKSMAPIGNARSGGFGPGVPMLRRQFTIASWESQDAFSQFFAEHPLSLTWRTACDHAWHVELLPHRARGTFRGPVQFEKVVDPPEGPIAALTVGRPSWRRSARFALDGTLLTGSILNANGVITALTAGFPPYGNATFSLWEQGSDMIEFSYGEHAPHRNTVQTDKRLRILEEQIAVRFSIKAIHGSWDTRTTPRSSKLRDFAQAVGAGEIRAVA
jgi:hypothetical protein